MVWRTLFKDRIMAKHDIAMPARRVDRLEVPVRMALQTLGETAMDFGVH